VPTGTGDGRCISGPRQSCSARGICADGDSKLIVGEVLQERPLGKAINNVKNNGPELLTK
jgi:hypothetical protein